MRYFILASYMILPTYKNKAVWRFVHSLLSGPVRAGPKKTHYWQFDKQLLTFYCQNKDTGSKSKNLSKYLFKMFF